MRGVQRTLAAKGPSRLSTEEDLCLVGPGLLFVVYFPLKGLSRLHQGLHVVSSSSTQGLASAQGQQEAEEGEDQSVYPTGSQQVQAPSEPSSSPSSSSC